jgi:hypothetical protein
MIFTFVLAVSLALISFLAGGYIVKVAIYTGVAKLAILIMALWPHHEGTTEDMVERSVNRRFRIETPVAIGRNAA